MARRDQAAVGVMFGSWTVIGPQFPQTRAFDGSDQWFAPCRCICGNARAVGVQQLLNGHSASCGCCRKPNPAFHGDAKKRLYRIWTSMRYRCANPNVTHYRHYGGRGIRVCAEWQSYPVFRAWAIVAGYADHLTLDRIDVNGNYEPTNCRWATTREQAINKRGRVYLDAFGESKLLAHWSQDPRCVVSERTLRHRMDHLGLSLEVAMTRPQYLPFPEGEN